MSPTRSRLTPSRSRRTPYRPPRDRREVALAVLASLLVILITGSLIWLLRPDTSSGVHPPDITIPPSTTAVGDTTTTLPTTSTP